MRAWRALAVVCAYVCAPACGPSATSPTDRPGSGQAPPARVITTIGGKTSDTAFRGLADVRLEIVSGSGAGLATNSDQEGNYSFSGTFSDVVAIRASKADFVATTRSLNVAALPSSSNARLMFGLEAVDTSFRLRPGAYSLTFSADPACTALPAELRSRTYAANLTPGTGDYPGTTVVEVPGLLFLQDRFLVGISGNYLATEDGGSPTLYERVSSTTYLGIDFIFGTTSFQVEGTSGFSTSFPGMFEYCSVTAGSAPTFCDFFPAAAITGHDRCFAPNHRMTLAPR